MSIQTDDTRTGDKAEARLEAAEKLSTAPAEPSQRMTRPGRRRPLGALLQAWRQLTSMRTALLLLFLLALAAVPGSLLPQRSSDPTLVDKYIADHPTLGPFLDRLSGFDVFGAPWFAAIYALLVISLIGCVIPRLRLHARALLRRPPKAPAHPARLASGIAFETSASIDEVVLAGRRVLRGRRFRVAADASTVSAEKGYLRETGNLLFHISLLILLAGIAIGGVYGYTGKVVVTTGDGFSNTLVQYDSFNHGALVNTDKLSPFTLRLQDMDTQFQPDGTPKLYSAKVAFRPSPSAPVTEHTIRVNDPLKVGEAKVYLINHGYSAHAVLRDRTGRTVYEAYVPCIASEIATLTSNCTFKIPDTGLPPEGPLKKPQQIGVTAGLVPTFDPRSTQGSVFPALRNPRIAGVQVYLGDLGLDAGSPQNVYVLDTAKMKQLDVKGANGSNPPMLNPNDPKADYITGLPDGLVLSVDGIRNFAVFSVKYDAGKGLVLWAAIAMLLGLIGSLLIRRRRLWIRASSASGAGRTVVEIGGLARTGSFTAEFDDLVGRVRSRLPDQDTVPPGQAAAPRVR
jgi:cytochrome c biogenesis protein